MKPEPFCFKKLAKKNRDVFLSTTNRETFNYESLMNKVSQVQVICFFLKL